MLGTLSEVLENKGGRVETVSPETTVSEAVRKMHQLNIGALLVLEGARLAGIFTERDVLYRVVDGKLDPAATPVSKVMTPEPVSVEPSMTIVQAMQLVTEKQFRHLPVVDDERVIGIVSSGDLTRWAVRAQAGHLAALISSV